MKGREYRNFINKESRWLIETLSGQLSNDYYIFSATQHFDSYERKNGSLVMWRGYGKENGCAIVFDKVKLLALADAFSKCGRVISTIDGEVRYLKEAEEVRKLFREEYTDFFKYLKYMASMLLNRDGKPLYPEVDGLNPYMQMKSLTKHHAFQSENEYRLSMLRSVPNIKRNDSNIINVKNGIIELPILNSTLPIKEIIISPFFNKDINYKILEEFVSSSPRYLNIKIRKSEIPHT